MNGFTFIPGTLLVEYNNGAFTNLWDWSDDGGNSWQHCDVTDPKCGPQTPKPAPVRTAQVTLPTGILQQSNWRGDPGLAASIDGQTVAMSNMANTSAQQGGDPNGVVISTSIDGGRHFINTVFANVPVATDHPCRLGVSTDQPSITADQLTANRYFVVWRQRTSNIGLDGTCGAMFDVNPSDGSVTFSPQSPMVVNAKHMLTHGVGGLIVQMAGKVVTVVNSDTDVAGDQNCDGPIQTDWWSTTSTDLGVSCMLRRLLDNGRVTPRKCSA